ncbi:MAG: transposase [Deltaproteobacteria bacterium]|nr:transposase [Deltaproteobacteria bacterium]
MRYGNSSLEAARNRAKNGTPENAAKARQRNGIEGAMSEAKRVQGIGRLRIRGTLGVTGANFLKMLGMTIKRGFNFVIERRRFCESS